MLNIIEKADDLYKNFHFEECYLMLLEHKDVAHEEIQWRLARVTCDWAKFQKDKQQRQDFMLEAFSYAEKALGLNSDSPDCHRWYGALLHFTTEGIGIKNKIETAFKVREHFDKVLEKAPDDPISHHSIGYWCFVFAETPWYQKKLASALFTSLPETSYDEALEWFLKADKNMVNENCRCTNTLMIAKTYLRLGHKEKAAEYLKRTLEFTPKTPDDEDSIKQAKEIKKSLDNNTFFPKLSW